MYLLTKRNDSPEKRLRQRVSRKSSADIKPQESPEEQVESLQAFLGYPVLERDRANRDYWYLRPGADVDEAENTAPIGVCFYDDLERKQEEVYKHYLGRSLAEQPVMYLLSPNGFDGEVSLVLPTEGGLKRRSIQEFNATLN
jgi:hypothetical protein